MGSRDMAFPLTETSTWPCTGGSPRALRWPRLASTHPHQYLQSEDSLSSSSACVLSCSRYAQRLCPRSSHVNPPTPPPPRPAPPARAQGLLVSSPSVPPSTSLRDPPPLRPP
eukprot:3500119-Rhodomonas_salina.1